MIVVECTQSMANAYLSYMLDDKKIGSLCFNFVKKEFFFDEYLPSQPMYYNKIYFQLNDDNPQPSIYVTFLTKDILQHHTIKQPFWLECDVYFHQRLLKYENSSNSSNSSNLNSNLSSNDNINNNIENSDSAVVVVTSAKTDNRSELSSTISKENVNVNIKGKIQNKVENKISIKSRSRYNYKASMDSKELLKLLQASNNNKFTIDFTKDDMIDIFHIFWIKRMEKIEAVKLVMCPPCPFNYKTKEEEERDAF